MMDSNVQQIIMNISPNNLIVYKRDTCHYNIDCCLWTKIILHDNNIPKDVIVVSGDGIVKVWCLNNNSFELLCMWQSENPYALVAIGLLKGRIIGCILTPSRLLIIDILTKTKIRELSYYDETFLQAKFIDGGTHIMTGNFNGLITVYKLETGTIAYNIATEKTMLSFSCSNCSSYIAICTAHGEVYLYKTESEGGRSKVLHRIKIEEETISYVAFSPNSSLLAFGTNNGGFGIYHVPSGCLISKTYAVDKWIINICFSPDSTRVVVTCATGVIHVVLVDGLKLICTFVGHPGILSVQFNDENDKLLILSRSIKQRCLDMYIYCLPMGS